MPAIIVLLSALLGGWIYRWHGGGWGIGGPRVLKNILFALPFAAPGWGAWGMQAEDFGASVSGVATGHGRGQSLKEPMKGTPEVVEFFTLWAQPHLPVYWYKCLTLFASGTWMASGGANGYLLTNNYYGAALTILGGMMKPIAYMIGWKIYPTGSGKGISPSLCQATQIGEFLTGFFQYGFLSLAMVLYQC